MEADTSGISQCWPLFSPTPTSTLHPPPPPIFSPHLRPLVKQCGPFSAPLTGPPFLCLLLALPPDERYEISRRRGSNRKSSPRAGAGDPKCQICPPQRCGGSFVHFRATFTTSRPLNRSVLETAILDSSTANFCLSETAESCQRSLAVSSLCCLQLDGMFLDTAPSLKRGA